MSTSTTDSLTQTIDRTSDVYIREYGNFHLFIKNIDEMFVDTIEDSDTDDLQIIAIYQPSQITTKNYQSKPFKKFNEQILPKALVKETEPNQTIKFSKEFILSKILSLEFNEIPDYLCDRNLSFTKKIYSILPQTNNMEKLYSITILMFKIIVLDMIQSLWKIYQKSSTGELVIDLPINDKLDRKIWPKEIQFLIQQHGLGELMKNKEENIYFILIKTCLDILNEQIETYHNELRLIAGSLFDYTPQVEDFLEEFVRQGLHCLHIEIDYQIALIHYDYQEEILKRQYFIENPDEIQIKLFERLCQWKYDYEITRNEVHLLEEKIPIHLSQHPFNSQSIVQSPMINSLPKSNLQQQLYSQYKTIIEQTKENKLNIYFESIKKQMKHCQKQLNLTMDESWKINKSVSQQQQRQFTPIMLDVIDRCLANIQDRIECIYTFIRKLFDVKSNI